MRVLFASSMERSEGSFLESLDVRSKMLVSALCALTVIFLDTVPALALLVLLSAAYMLSGKRWTLTLVAYTMLFLLWCFAIFFSWLTGLFFPGMGHSGAGGMLVPFLRSAVLVNTVLAMAISSRIQGILTALKSLRLPYWLYVPAAVMVRFLPSFIYDIKQIVETMKIRGYSFGPLSLIAHPLLSIRLLFVPLIFRALRSSDELGVAAELKGVGYRDKPSAYREDQLGMLDGVLIAATIMTLASVLMINQLSGGQWLWRMGQ